MRKLTQSSTSFARALKLDTAAFATDRGQVPAGHEARLGEASLCPSCGKEVRLRHVGNDLCLWIARDEPADAESRCDGRTATQPSEFRITRHHARNRLSSYPYTAVVRR